MARPIEFEREEVLNKALLAFWRFGYDGCSLQTLVEFTGLKRQSLYNVFGDKNGIFIASIAKYRSILDNHSVILLSQTANLDTLREFIIMSLAVQGQEGSGGCFLVSTAFSPHIKDPKIQSAVQQGAADLRQRFEQLLERMIKRGELLTDICPKNHAAAIYTLLNGLSALRQTGASLSQIHDVLDLYFKDILQRKKP